MALFQSLVQCTHYIVAAVCYGYTHVSTLIRSVSQQTPRHVHRAAVRTLMRSFSIHPTFRISKVSRRFLCFFSRNRLSTSTVFGSDISLRQDSAVRALQLSILTNVYVSCLPCPRQLVAVLVLHAMENLLALALPVADAVSFEFDGINVTAQHVMARSVPLMRLLAFYDQFIKSQ